MADKALILEALISELLAIPMLIAFFVFPLWIAILLVPLVISALYLLVDAVIPLVAQEPLGSSADIRRAGIRFWLVAPICLAIVVLLWMGLA